MGKKKSNENVVMMIMFEMTGWNPAGAPAETIMTDSLTKLNRMCDNVLRKFENAVEAYNQTGSEES